MWVYPLTGFSPTPGGSSTLAWHLCVRQGGGDDKNAGGAGRMLG
jgi:hypothetical protein